VLIPELFNCIEKLNDIHSYHLSLPLSLSTTMDAINHPLSPSPSIVTSTTSTPPEFFRQAPTLRSNSQESLETTIALDTDAVSISRKVSFNTALKLPVPPPPSILRQYQPPVHGRPQPFFIKARYRFPRPKRRVLPTHFDRPEYAPHHPGVFPADFFKDIAWSSTPIAILDDHITLLERELYFYGTDYTINVFPSVWRKKKIVRGTPITFRGATPINIRYIATWTLATTIDHAFVQFSPFYRDQTTLYHDLDWPTLRIKVPVELCDVTPCPTADEFTIVNAPSPTSPTWLEHICFCLCLSSLCLSDPDDDL
jgi:hypothetical protein